MEPSIHENVRKNNNSEERFATNTADAARTLLNLRQGSDPVSDLAGFNYNPETATAGKETLPKLRDVLPQYFNPKDRRVHTNTNDETENAISRDASSKMNLKIILNNDVDEATPRSAHTTQNELLDPSLRDINPPVLRPNLPPTTKVKSEEVAASRSLTLARVGEEVRSSGYSRADSFVLTMEISNRGEVVRSLGLTFDPDGDAAPRDGRRAFHTSSGSVMWRNEKSSYDDKAIFYHQKGQDMLPTEMCSNLPGGFNFFGHREYRASPVFTKSDMNIQIEHVASLNNIDYWNALMVRYNENKMETGEKIEGVVPWFLRAPHPDGSCCACCAIDSCQGIHYCTDCGVIEEQHLNCQDYQRKMFPNRDPLGHGQRHHFYETTYSLEPTHRKNGVYGSLGSGSEAAAAEQWFLSHGGQFQDRSAGASTAMEVSSDETLSGSSGTLSAPSSLGDSNEVSEHDHDIFTHGGVKAKLHRTLAEIDATCTSDHLADDKSPQTVMEVDLDNTFSNEPTLDGQSDKTAMKSAGLLV